MVSDFCISVADSIVIGERGVVPVGHHAFLGHSHVRFFHHRLSAWVWLFVLNYYKTVNPESYSYNFILKSIKHDLRVVFESGFFDDFAAIGADGFHTQIEVGSNF